MSALWCAVLLAAPADDGWRTLFNGKDLTGWRANNDPESFAVIAGTIRANAQTTAAHLFYVGDRKAGVEPFKDFELEAVCRGEPEANSGIFVHTDMTTSNAQKHLAKGYEVQLNSTAKEKRKTGSLYAVVDLDTSPVDETKWFTVRVTVKGKAIGVFLDGKQVVEYTEPDNVVRPKERAGRKLDPAGGGIAIQAHDPKSVFYFQSVRLRPLK